MAIRPRRRPADDDDGEEDDGPPDDSFVHAGVWSRRGGDVMMCSEHGLTPEDH
jgi:hypothetical protein